MREIYLWTDWFTELAGKIAEGGKEFLIERAKQVAWKDDDRTEPLLLPHYGAESIDPFSFVYSLASLGKPEWRERVYSSVSQVFNVNAPLPVDADEAFFFPVPNRRQKLLFHNEGEGDPQLLWRLFRTAVSRPESVNPQDFSSALEIDPVTIPKLTQALFLINPAAFLPCDEVTRILRMDDFPEVINWTQYQDELQGFRDAFPGCALYEINLFAYLWKRGDIRKERTPIQYFHVSTNAWGAGGPDFWNGTDPQHEQRYFEPNHWVFTGGPGVRGMGWHEYDEPRDGAPGFPLRHPRPGDVVLVRTGLHRGRGIGIVYRNDYQDRLDGNSRIHVVWVSRRDEDLIGQAEMAGFNYARPGTLNAFRQVPAYTGTFALLTRLSRREELMADQEASKNPNAEHPRNQILYGPPGTGKTYHTVDRALAIINRVSLEEVERDFEGFRNLRFDPNSGSGQIAMVTFHQNFAYEDFIEGIRPVLDEEADGRLGYERHDGIFKQIADAARGERGRRFVLIIDEINRGNIAKIFGELITLIEASRRIGRDDETEVTLPYSNESFGVPDNLYIIGTMNTADRSIQLLDTALRRRFDFVEMMPNYKYIQEIKSEDEVVVDCKKMIEVMNWRITALLDREHQIGHTYLMGVDTMNKLSNAFRNKIFPLLQEYFFNDWSKIQAVLGRNRSFVQTESEQKTKSLFAGHEQVADEARPIYKRLPDGDGMWIRPDQYRRIYETPDQ